MSGQDQASGAGAQQEDVVSSGASSLDRSRKISPSSLAYRKGRSGLGIPQSVLRWALATKVLPHLHLGLSKARHNTRFTGTARYDLARHLLS